MIMIIIYYMINKIIMLNFEYYQNVLGLLLLYLFPINIVILIFIMFEINLYSLCSKILDTFNRNKNIK
jgi:hypothetical protein